MELRTIETMKDAVISVVICTRNPRPAVLARVLDALAKQTLATHRWELVVVDNASASPPLIPALPPRLSVRTVVEKRAGLTSARLCGIRQARGDLIVFVDDDNVLAPDYLSTAISIAASHPTLGAFGGIITAECECPPPSWLEPFLPNLAVCNLKEDIITDDAHAYASIPCGAGLCVRSAVATLYAHSLHNDQRRMALDRRGDSLRSCGDWDIVLTGMDAGWSMGRFTSLRVSHVIPASRLTYDYNKRLAYSIGESIGLLIAIRRPIPFSEKVRRGLRTTTSFLGLHGLGYHRGIDLSYQFGLFRGMCCGTSSSAPHAIES